MRLFNFLFVLILTQVAWANPIYDDTLMPDENFTGFVSRITRGGVFNGLHLDAPPKFQKNFYKHIKKSYWTGQRNLVRQNLIAKGVDYWFKWSKINVPSQIIFSSPQDRLIFEMDLKENLNLDSELKMDSSKVLESPWSDLNLTALNVYIKTLLTHKTLFKNSFIDQLAVKYGVDASVVLNSTEILILNNKDFKIRLADLGYRGRIYFRAISGEIPTQPGKYLVLINDELMRKKTEYHVPTFQFLEYLAIAMHEISHVMQDFAANKLGITLQIGSYEGLFILEGMAENFAQQTLVKVAKNYPGVNALELFAWERGMEVAFREGNKSSGQLFPYTVGTPFVFSMLTLAVKSEEKLRDDLLYIISNNKKLEDVLFDNY